MKFADFNFLRILDDVYFISEKIKAFNENFRLMFNLSKNVYEVRDISDMAVVLTEKNYPSHKTMKRLYESRGENLEKLFESIDAYNENLIKENEENISLKSKCQLAEVLGYAEKNPSKELSQKEIRKIIGENYD